MKMRTLFKMLLICGLASFMLVGCGLTGKYSRATFEGEAIHFDYDKYALRPEAKPILDYKIAYLKHFPGQKILIVGHCDARADDEYNIRLGRLRAEEAKRYLVEGGINANRIEIMTEGKRDPKAAGASSSSFAENRRAEFFITAINNAS
ncbi:hypothetical protein C4J81_11925 [Deltaproteobacteria bacterium Smac51]|nr:hypothetical protein C4J81_11925 [Deltaproteobacteria bacterium Smac51]